jgi:outer membrane protein TolC
MGLFRSSRADFIEVLITHRYAIEARFQTVETKRKQMLAIVNPYVALGGGWR